MTVNTRKNNDSNGLILIGLIILLLLLTIFAGRFFRSENKLNILFHNNQTISTIVGIYDENQQITSINVLFFNSFSNRVSGVYLLPSTYTSFIKNNKSVFLTLSEALKKDINKEEIKNGISRLLGTKINYYLFIKENNFIKYIDLIGGVEIYTEEISIPETNIYYPSGIIQLDGDKALEYIKIQSSAGNEYDTLKRSDIFIKSLFQLKDDFAQSNNEIIITDFLYPLFSTNLSINDFLIFYKQILKRYNDGITDFSRFFLSTIVYCDKDTKDGVKIYLPKQSGNWIRSQITDNLEKLSRKELKDIGNKITVQLLNGTDNVGFANRTKHYIESFGFDVVEVSNADNQDYRNTIVIIQGSEEKALKLAELIRCKKITKNENENNTTYDLTLILGKDFDGRVVK